MHKCKQIPLIVFLLLGVYFYVHCFSFHNASGKNDLPGCENARAPVRFIISFAPCVCVCVHGKSVFFIVVSYANRCMWKRFGIYSYAPSNVCEDPTKLPAVHKKLPCILLYFSLFEINYIISHYTVGCFVEHTEQNIWPLSKSVAFCLSLAERKKRMHYGDL